MSNEIELHTDKDGNLDTAYYINQAHQLRSEYLGELYTSTVSKFKTLLHLELPKIINGRHAHH
ncbi:RSP_7527 family protein [Neptunomonas sp.]|uniref:RSP_7527 family protein n=1 Tax=Neptunomonas sp. TaxID=1971898 RepID=UPI0025D6A80A|nr:hypothetical protein [Neptunomonas sp.]